ncbi:MAG: ABC transporter permease [Promicromonosporaceae bacterium]|nr:ABC transporter permease [Promicromonosporaceae bacterium]
MSATTVTPLSTPTSLRQLGLLVQWQLRRGADMVPFLVVVQVLLSVTTVFGYGLLVGTPPPDAAAYLATGAATVTLIMVGLVMTPQGVGQSKTEGSLAWMRTLPVPRWAYLASDLVVWTLIALPGSVLGVVAGAWRFDVTLSISPWIVLAAPLVSLVAATVGYSMALLLKPQLAALVSQVIVFVVLLFSPISFPAARLPQWLGVVHDWLPIQPMAELMRAMLLSDTFQMSTRSSLVLAAWTVVALAGAGRALARRS